MPNVLHLFWLPEPSHDFMQMGGFRLWVETPKFAKTKSAELHPYHLHGKPLAEWLQATLSQQTIVSSSFEPLSLFLPTAGKQPLPCPELLPETDEKLPDQAEWGEWIVDCYHLTSAPIHTINELHYRLLFQGGEVRPGQDFLFWYYYTQ